MNARPLAVTAVLTLGLALAGCAGGTGMAGMDHSGHGSASASASTASPADVAFVQQMLPHHQQAVEMSSILLAKSDIDPEVVALAQDITAAQQPEIAQLQSWLQEWGVSSSASPSMDHGGHDGMMSSSDLAALQAAAGSDAAQLFLSQMIEHHKGAVQMADQELADGQDPDVVALAQQIVDTQTSEIATMQQLQGRV